MLLRGTYTAWCYNRRGIGSEVGPFGTAFMDDAGNFYVGNNTSGKVFKINQVNLGTITASLFSSGTSISPGDGARCPFSPVALIATSDVASTTAGVGVAINVLAINQVVWPWTQPKSS